MENLNDKTLSLTTFITTNKAKIKDIPVVNRRFVFVKDSKELYIDYNNIRSQISDVIILETESELSSVITPLENKFYFCIDTHRLYRFNVLNNKFYAIGGKQDVVIEVLDKKFSDFIASDINDYSNKLVINLMDYMDNLTISKEIAKAYEYIVVLSRDEKEYCDITDLYPAEKVVLDETAFTLTLYVDSMPSDMNTPYKFNILLSDSYH